MPVVFESRWQLSLSFSDGCELQRVRLSYGTRDAKAVEFKHVRRSQTHSDLRGDEGVSVATPGRFGIAPSSRGWLRLTRSWALPTYDRLDGGQLWLLCPRCL